MLMVPAHEIYCFWGMSYLRAEFLSGLSSVPRGILLLVFPTLQLLLYELRYCSVNGQRKDFYEFNTMLVVQNSEFNNWLTVKNLNGSDHSTQGVEFGFELV